MLPPPLCITVFMKQNVLAYSFLNRIKFQQLVCQTSNDWNITNWWRNEKPYPQFQAIFSSHPVFFQGHFLFSFLPSCQMNLMLNSTAVCCNQSLTFFILKKKMICKTDLFLPFSSPHCNMNNKTKYLKFHIV